MKKGILLSVFAAIVLSACSTEPIAETGHIYKVVAHRGGYLENGLAENSVKSLRKTIEQRCYASECDVMWTADDKVLICHPSGPYLVNGLDPSTHTLTEIRMAGKLSDGSMMPCLEDFLKILMDKKQNPFGTKLWLDIKGASNQTEKKVMLRAAEIAREMNACHLVEYLVPDDYADYIGISLYLRKNYGIACAWNKTITEVAKYGVNGWGQLPYHTYNKDNIHWPPTSYTDNGVNVSIYHTPSTIDSYANLYQEVVPYYPVLKAIFVNHPQALIDYLIEAGYEEINENS